jgi:hypothetical protein
MKKKMIWFFSWCLFGTGLFSLLIEVFFGDLFSFNLPTILLFGMLLPRFILSAFYLVAYFYDYMIFSLIAPFIVFAGVLLGAYLTFPSANFWLLIFLGLGVFLLSFLFGNCKHQQWLQAWTDRSQRVLVEIATPKRVIREG